MIGVAGHMCLDPQARDEFVEAHLQVVESARAATGCLDASISVDPFDSSRVNVFELWSTAEDLNQFRSTTRGPDTKLTPDEDHVIEFEFERSWRPFSGPDARG